MQLLREEKKKDIRIFTEGIEKRRRTRTCIEGWGQTALFLEELDLEARVGGL